MDLDLTKLKWELTGWRPLAWKYGRSVETTFWLEPEVGPVEGRLPGSVQDNLLRAGLLPDWNDGLNSLAVEWVEHRHWMFEALLPEVSEPPVFAAESLDYAGWVLVNRRIAGTFRGPHLPVEIDLASAWGDEPGPRRLGIVFGTPPECHGQVGYTSETRELKPRYNYSWDWCPRLVPLGASGRMGLVPKAAAAVELTSIRTELAADLEHGRILVRLKLKEAAEVEVSCGEIVEKHRGTAGNNEFVIDILRPALWWPNGEGDQPLHNVCVTVKDGTSSVVWEQVRTVGFKRVEWHACDGAPADARPWVCVVNGRPLFLQGVNWTPERLASMDATAAETEELVGLYREMGCNLVRVWGGAVLGSSALYDACDRAGLLVWQEFPLSSSGLDSVPPGDAAVIAELREVARHFVRSRQHHASLLMWCGGNELEEGREGEDLANRRPCDESNPCLAAFGEVVAEEDPGRRYIPTSPSGPSFLGKRENFGQGVHHQVHGPWGLGDFRDLEDWRDYWRNDDALFRSEVGVAAAADMDLLRRHAASLPLWPPTTALWRHAANWWTQEQRLLEPFAHLPPEDALAAYVEHTRREQAQGLAIAASACKDRFPRCGGFVVWMGHDCFPCPANTSLIDFARKPKPAWHALREVFRRPAG